MALAEIEDADGAREQAEHADHGKAGEDGEHERLGYFARDHGKPDRRHGKGEREKHDKPDTAVPFGAVGGGLGIAHRRINICHAFGKYPIRIVLTGDCHVREVTVAPWNRFCPKGAPCG